MPATLRLVAAGLCAAALVACGPAASGAPTAAPAPAADHGDDHSHAAVEEMPHLHGLGFSADGAQLIVPAHTGLRVYEGGVWHTPDAPAHDYMGFAAVDDGFYSSGHPDPASGMVNPLGLVKSTDGGRTLQKLGFEGESDFHLMGVGYRSHAIYLVNPAPNSRMQPGPYYSLDRGATWQPFAGQGVSAQPYAIAVHPSEPGSLALPTDAGLMRSTDYGASFARVGPAERVTAAAFTLDGARLLFGSTGLAALDLASGAVTPLDAPALAAEDLFIYLADSPADPAVIAAATLQRDVFLSEDGGQTWRQIADDGLPTTVSGR